MNLNRAVPVTWLRRAWVLLHLGQADAALEANATAMRLDPNDVNPIVQRAWLMNNLGRPGEGLRLSEQALTQLRGRQRLSLTPKADAHWNVRDRWRHRQ